jgi:hypothetical protein
MSLKRLFRLKSIAIFLAFSLWVEFVPAWESNTIKPKSLAVLIELQSSYASNSLEIPHMAAPILLQTWQETKDSAN